MLQYDTVSLLVGGNSPYSPAFESIAAQTVQGVLGSAIQISYPRRDVMAWDGCGESALVDRPRADLSYRTLWGSGWNERLLFTFGQSGSVSALSAMNEERNYYLIANLDGVDAVGYQGINSRVLSLGNGVLTRYEFSAAVGQPTTANVSVQGLNLLIQASGSGQPLPAIGKQGGTATTGLYTLPIPTQTVRNYFEAAPAAIQLTFDTGSAIGLVLSGQNSCPIESFSFSVDLPRTEVKNLGWAYPEYRPVQWPATINIQADARLNGFQLDAINRYGCPDSGHAFTVGFKSDCSALDAVSFQFQGAKLDTESLDIQVGQGTATASFNWSLKVYDINRTGPNSPNFYINGAQVAYTSIVFPQVDYLPGQNPLVMNLGTPCYLSILSGPGFLVANSIYVTDSVATIVVRAVAADDSDTQDITINVTL